VEQLKIRDKQDKINAYKALHKKLDDDKIIKGLEELNRKSNENINNINENKKHLSKKEKIASNHDDSSSNMKSQ